MRCSFIAAGRQPCPFGCKRHWVICHSFLESSCPNDQWEWCSNGWHTTEENLNAKYDPRNKTVREDSSSKPISEREIRRSSRSRSTDESHKRAPADTLSGEVSTRTVRCQKWQLEPKLQSAMVALGIYSLVLPTSKEADEALTRKLRQIELQAVDGASSNADEEKVKLAYTTVRGAIATHDQASSSSRDPPSLSR